MRYSRGVRFSRAKPAGSFRVYHPSSRRVTGHADTLREARTDAAFWSKQTPNLLEIQERFPSGEWVTVEAVHGTSKTGSAHATMKSADHPSGLEWSDLAPTDIRVEVGMREIPLEDASAVEIRRDMNRRLAGFRAAAHVPARRRKWAREVHELAQAKPWLMDQVPHDVWGRVLADLAPTSVAHATTNVARFADSVAVRLDRGEVVTLPYASTQEAVAELVRRGYRVVRSGLQGSPGLPFTTLKR